MCLEGHPDGVVDGLVVRGSAKAEPVEVLEGGVVEDAELEVNGLALGREPADHGVVVLARTLLEPAQAGRVPGDLQGRAVKEG